MLLEGYARASKEADNFHNEIVALVGEDKALQRLEVLERKRLGVAQRQIKPIKKKPVEVKKKEVKEKKLKRSTLKKMLLEHKKAYKEEQEAEDKAKAEGRPYKKQRVEPPPEIANLPIKERILLSLSLLPPAAKFSKEKRVDESDLEYLKRVETYLFQLVD